MLTRLRWTKYTRLARRLLLPLDSTVVIERARQLGLSFAPGIMTPSDIEAGLELGCRVLRIFPAETTGGLKHLKAMAAPYQHLKLPLFLLANHRRKYAKLH